MQNLPATQLDHDLDREPNRIDIQRAFKLRYQNNLSYQEIADIFNVSKQAVHERLTNFLKILPDKQVIETYRLNKAALMESVQLKHLEALHDQARLEKASLNNVAYAFSQLDNAIRLEQNKPTSNVAVHAIIQQRKQEREVNEIKGSGG